MHIICVHFSEQRAVLLNTTLKNTMLHRVCSSQIHPPPTPPGYRLGVTYKNHLYISNFSVWADDSWLKEHAGATLNTEAEDEQDSDVKEKEGTDTTKEDTTTVRNSHLPFRISLRGHVIYDNRCDIFLQSIYHSAVGARVNTLVFFVRHVNLLKAGSHVMFLSASEYHVNSYLLHTNADVICEQSSVYNWLASNISSTWNFLHWQSNWNGFG